MIPKIHSPTHSYYHLRVLPLPSHRFPPVMVTRKKTNRNNTHTCIHTEKPHETLEKANEGTKATHSHVYERIYILASLFQATTCLFYEYLCIHIYIFIWMPGIFLCPPTKGLRILSLREHSTFENPFISLYMNDLEASKVEFTI